MKMRWMAGLLVSTVSLDVFAAGDARFAYQAARVSLDPDTGHVIAAGFRHSLAQASVVMADTARYQGSGDGAPYVIELTGLRIAGSDAMAGGLAADAGVFYPHLRTLSADRLVALPANGDVGDDASATLAAALATPGGWTCEDRMPRWNGEPVPAGQACVAAGAAAFAIRCQADGRGVDVVVMDRCGPAP